MDALKDYMLAVVFIAGVVLWTAITSLIPESQVPDRSGEPQYVGDDANSSIYCTLSGCFHKPKGY